MADDVTFVTVTGLWSHIVDDGVVDDDSNPDVVYPKGKVTFTPRLGSNGYLPAGDPTASVTVAAVTAAIVDGILTDLQGREGVLLAATVGGYPIYWTATPTLEWKGVKLPSKSITFDARQVGGTHIHLNDLSDITPPAGNDNGAPTPTGVLHLPAVGDFTYSYRLSNGEFAEGAELYYLLGAAPAPTLRWNFDIDGDTATIVVAVADHGSVPPGTRFWLLHKASAMSPAKELLTGPVRKATE
ncbi:minor tail protein [Gordonia phage William]|uniref:Minor tail protein n=1 Tax=Gordonia phage William TaxID=2571253 RepID=A0A4Y6EEJ1_9CAUD|nr:minor tail protein [Gordonia phage William]QDF17126.1 minor tail protein [Gordonia phage William]